MHRCDELAQILEYHVIVNASDSNPDVAIIGAGAAGLATAIFAARNDQAHSIFAFDGAKKIGAKILVSGGGRCNVTNTIVLPDDFTGTNRNIIKRVLAAFPADQAAAFFGEIGVALHEEDGGKLFPDTNDARTVLDALLAEARRLGIRLLADHRVLQVERRGEHFEIATSQGLFAARAVVLATGGLSLPKTGSDGFGYSLARSLGHSLVPTTPALAPLILDGDFHIPLSGIAHPVEITIRVEGAKPVRLRGPLLWTHFGVSGPVVLNASRFWHRARLQNLSATVTASLIPDDTFETAEAKLLELAAAQPRARLLTAMTSWLPARVSAAVLAQLRLRDAIVLAHLSRDDRRRLINAMLAWPLAVRDSRGYAYAEVTAGGVPLDEIDPAAMASRKCKGLYFVGEILDCDGRIGGFNFQWAWSTAHVAARGLSAFLAATASARGDQV